MKTTAQILGYICLLVFIVFYGSFAWGFVTYKFWHWFILPVFPNMPLVTLLQAIGLSTFIGLFKGTKESVKKEYREDSSTIIPWIAPLVVFGIGWIIHLLM